MQLAGGVGQGLLEPVVRRLGLLLAGAVARRGGAQQVGAERGAGAEPGHIQRRGQHRPRVRAGGLGVLPAGDQLRRGRQGLGQPVPGRPSATASRGSRAAAARARSCSAGLNSGSMRMTAARSSTSRSRACGSAAAGRGHGGVGGVPVRPQRADDHHRVGALSSARTIAAGQPVLAVQVALQLIQPHHRPRRRRLAASAATSAGPAGCTSHQSGSSVFTASTRASGLPDRGPADAAARTRPAAAAACHPGPDTELGGVDIPRNVLRRDVIGYSLGR